LLKHTHLLLKNYHQKLNPNKFLTLIINTKPKKSIKVECYGYFLPFLMDRVVASHAFLVKLIASRVNKSQILKRASDEEIQVLCEIGLNICKGNFQLSARQIRKLRPFAKIIRSLCKKKSVEKARQSLLKENRLFAPLINPVLKHAKILSRP